MKDFSIESGNDKKLNNRRESSAALKSFQFPFIKKEDDEEANLIISCEGTQAKGSELNYYRRP